MIDQSTIDAMRADNTPLVKTALKEDDVFQDSGIEWRILNKILLPQYKNHINTTSPMLFTGIRADVFAAMQKAYINYGIITYEGIHQYMEGKVPGELTAATQGDLPTLIAQGVRLATKRQLKRQSDLMKSLAYKYNPEDHEIQRALQFETVTLENESSLLFGSQAFLGNLHAKNNGDYTFARTGFKVTDRYFGGEWRRKGVVVLAGGVGAGKTTFWMNSSKKMAKGIPDKQGILVQTATLFISLEMSQEDLILKMVADELSIDNTDLASGEFEKIAGMHDVYDTAAEVLDAVERATAELQKLPIYVIENGKLTLAQIVYEIRKHVQKYGVRVVAIDYLQLINHHPTGNANNDLGDVAEALKDLAKREDITVVLLSQINRSGEGYDAIRDSGEVQAVVDVIIQLVPDDEDGLTNTGGLKSIYLCFWKNRWGRAGTKAPLLFNGAYQRFEDNKAI